MSIAPYPHAALSAATASPRVADDPSPASEALHLTDAAAPRAAASWRDQGPEPPRQARWPGGQRGRGLHGQLVQQLGFMIVSGDLGDDRPLVPEEIGQRFEVSRTVVRESLRVLEAKGLVSARPNVGTRIRPTHEWNLFDPDVIEWRAYGPGGDEQRQELIELWCGIEPVVARSAAGRLDQGALDELTALHGTMTRAHTDGDASLFSHADVEFHTLVLRAAGNRLLGHLGAIIDAALHVSGMALAGCEQFSAPAAAAHGRLIEALAVGDQEAAEAVARSLVAGAAGLDRVLPGQRAQL